MNTTQKMIIAGLLTGSFLAYSFYLYYSLPASKPVVVNAKAKEGKVLWQKYNCTACHQIYGLGGYLGPDLTNVYSKKGEAYIRAFLKSGTPVMPDFRLPDGEIVCLVSYLRNIDASGRADPKTYRANYDGTIEQQ